MNRRAFVQGLAALASLPSPLPAAQHLRFRVHHILHPVDGAWRVAGRLMVVRVLLPELLPNGLVQVGTKHG